MFFCPLRMTLQTSHLTGDYPLCASTALSKHGDPIFVLLIFSEVTQGGGGVLVFLTCTVHCIFGEHVQCLYCTVLHCPRQAGSGWENDTQTNSCRPQTQSTRCSPGKGR